MSFNWNANYEIHLLSSSADTFPQDTEKIDLGKWPNPDEFKEESKSPKDVLLCIIIRLYFRALKLEAIKKGH